MYTLPIFQYAKRCLYLVGILGLILSIAALLFPRFILHEPVGFFIERTANHLKTSGGSSKQRYLGNQLLKYLPINDWQNPQLSQLSLLTSLNNWQGQGAHPSNQFVPQQFNSVVPQFAQTGIYDSHRPIHYVSNSQELLSAINNAHAGDTIQLQPGNYPLTKNITLTYPGTPDAPITIRAAQLGQVKITIESQEGFRVSSPYWVFENLEIQGQCNLKNHTNCEHAFHVVGKAHSFVLRNNRISDFNASLKVNGDSHGNYPDYGLIEKNSFFNTQARQTTNPVTLLNINSVNHWVVRGNLIADFSKSRGNYISYGSFMKGNGKDGLYENNLIICEHILPADKGVRIGLSLGGGGTSQNFCREQSCETEHNGGTIRNNIILNCSHDVAIYLNKAKSTQIYNNLIFNSLGIDVRFNSSSARIFNNIISGRIKTRDGGSYTETNNLLDLDCISPSRQFSNCSFLEWYWDPVNVGFSLNNGEELIEKGVPSEFETDFCDHQKHSEVIDIGPIQYSNQKKCLPDDIYL